MFDIELVKLRYARMENEELLYLVHNNKYGLRTDAISALYKEFLKRNLDISIFPELRAAKIFSVYMDDDVPIEYNITYFTSLQEKCINMISKGYSLDDTHKHLLKSGIRNVDALRVINSLPEYSIAREDKYNIEMVKGLAISLLGIFIIALLSISGNPNIFFAGLMLIIPGAIKIVIGFHKKGKYIRSIQLLKRTEMPYLGKIKKKNDNTLKAIILG